MPAAARLRGLAALPVLLATVIAGLLVTAPSSSAATAAGQATRGYAIAAQQIGDPYRLGATGPNAFDCSGLVYYSFRRAGFSGVPRTSAAQAAYAHRIPRGQLRTGDLVFFYTGRATASDVYHVGIFAGRRGGRPVVLHAPHPGSRVHLETVWTDHWFAGAP